MSVPVPSMSWISSSLEVLPCSSTMSPHGQTAVGDVDAVVAQRLHHLAGVLVVADGDRVVLPLGVPLVLVVADQLGLLALLVRLEGVRARSDDALVLTERARGVGVGVDDRHRGGREHEREGGVGLVEVEDHLALARRLDPLEAAQQTGGTAVDVDLADAVDRVLDRLRVQCAAVGEGESLAQLAAEHLVGGVGELAVLRRVRLRGRRADRVTQQRLVNVAEQLPGTVPGRGRIQRARRAGGSHDDGALVLRAVGRQNSTSGQQGRYGRDGRHPPQASIPVEHAHAPRSAIPRVGERYRSDTPADPPGNGP